ncbi:MAG: AarF/UbiB family protein [Planctomycetota bacterium]
MRLTSIPQLYRNLRRWQEILAVLQRYGLADWLSRFRSLPFRDVLKDRGGVSLAQYSREQRVRLALTELGPTFIKMGQVLAARPDLVGPSLGEELKRLRADVRPDPIEVVESTLAEELGEDFRTHFQSIDSTPLATASIGQVHRAVLTDGRRVVIKVQRHGIDSTIHEDMDVLSGLAQLAERVESFAAWGPAKMVDQLAPVIFRELDFGRERQHLETFAVMLKQHSADIVIPMPVPELCSRRVLVMDELVGAPLATVLSGDATDDLKESGDSASIGGSSTDEILQASDQMHAVDAPEFAKTQRNGKPRQRVTSLGPSQREKLSETIAGAYLMMVFDDGLFHADPHSGNLVLLDDGRLGILDFGMVGRIDESLRENIEEMLVAIAGGDQSRLTRLIRRVGDAPPTLDESALSVDVADFVGTYSRQNLGQFDLTGALNDLSGLLHSHHIKLPNQSALLLKMLISLEGTLREIGARFDSLDVVRGFMRKSMLRRLSPRRRLRQARRIYLEAENLLETAPDEVLSLLQQARKGEAKIMLEHMRIGPTVNRLVLGLMASAVFLGSSLMLAFKVPPVLFSDQTVLGIRELSLIGLLGVSGSFAVMMRLLLAIQRSGHLTRDNDD